MLLELRNIVKKFPGGIVASDHVNFDLREGEVHTLLGENGAGKTTLMNILFGLYRMDEGEIYLQGRRVHITSPAHALSLGIGMVQQHFTLVPSFTVAENIALGLKKYKFKVDFKEVSKRIEEISKLYNLNIDPSAKVWQLSVGERQKVEILKLLYAKAKIMILDEPTAVLTPQEVESLFKAIRMIKESGTGVIFISHKLREVMEISDRVTVLKSGKVVGTLNRDELDPRKLANMMVGRDVVLKVEKKPKEPGKIVLRVSNLHALNDKGLPALKGISFEMREGEIFGIAGVAGNGQRELAEVIYGLRKPADGKIELLGRDITHTSVMARIKMGISYIPQDRNGVATCPNLSVAENLFLKDQQGEFLFNLKDVVKRSLDRIEKYSILTPNPNFPLKLLSGGNIQKVVIAREFENEPKLIIAEHPTRGLDVGSMEFVYRSLLKARDEGKAILLLAGDLEEIFTISDRVAVIYEGEIMGYVEPDPSNLEKIGLMMAGVRDV